MKLDIKMARKIGKAIRRRRKELGLTQRKLAERTPFNETYIGRIERSERVPAMPAFFIISGALETTPSHLLRDCRKGPDREQIRQQIGGLLEQVRSLTGQL